MADNYLQIYRWCMDIGYPIPRWLPIDWWTAWMFTADSPLGDSYRLCIEEAIDMGILDLLDPNSIFSGTIENDIEYINDMRELESYVAS